MFTKCCHLVIKDQYVKNVGAQLLKIPPVTCLWYFSFPLLYIYVYSIDSCNMISDFLRLWCSTVHFWNSTSSHVSSGWCSRFIDWAMETQVPITWAHLSISYYYVIIREWDHAHHDQSSNLRTTKLTLNPCKCLYYTIS